MKHTHKKPTNNGNKENISSVDPLRHPHFRHPQRVSRGRIREGIGDSSVFVPGIREQRNQGCQIGRDEDAANAGEGAQTHIGRSLRLLSLH